MKVQQINNQKSFGIRYVNSRTWDPIVRDTVHKSNLVKEINKKYPNAKVEFNETKLDKNLPTINNRWINDVSYLFSLTFHLNSEMKYSALYSYQQNLSEAKNSVLTNLKNLTLEEVEKYIASKKMEANICSKVNGNTNHSATDRMRLL